MTLKELRVYHWNAAVRARADAEFCALQKGSEARVMCKGWNRRADWHMGAVRALNDVVQGSAEQDAAEASQLKVGATLVHRDGTTTHVPIDGGITGTRATCVITDDPLKGE